MSDDRSLAELESRIQLILDAETDDFTELAQQLGRDPLTDLAWADLQRIDLSGKDLTGADLTGADLTGANLSDAILAGANLSHSNLSNANLRRANLTGATLSYANLQNADLTDATLNDVVWSNAIVSGARFNFVIGLSTYETERLRQRGALFSNVQNPPPAPPSGSKQVFDPLPPELQAPGQRLVCQYVNSTNQVQIARITNVPNWYFERVVFPGQRLMFETPSQAILEVHSGITSGASMSDTIPCDRLAIEQVAVPPTVVDTAIQPGQVGRVIYDGVSWPARCDLAVTIAPGEGVEIVGEDNGVLLVMPVDRNHQSARSLTSV